MEPIVVNVDPVEKFVSVEEAVMRGEGPDQDPVSATMPPPESISEITAKAMLSVAESVRVLVQNQQATRQVPYSEIDMKSPWNPEGKRVRKTLKFHFSEHGIWCNPLTMSEEEMELVSQLKPGRYLNRRVEVQRDNEGNINLEFPWDGVQQRMENAMLWKDLADLCRQIIAERKVKEEKKRLGVVEEFEILN